MQKLSDKILHPFLLGIYPVAALLANNIQEIRAQSALRSFILFLLGATILVILLRAIFRNDQRAALVASVILVLFFTYGHIYNFLRGVAPFGFTLGRHRLLLPVWLGLFLLGLRWAARKERDLTRLTWGLNVLSAILLIFPLIQIGLFNFQPGPSAAEHLELEKSASLHLPPGQTAPDIYYIILDGYGRDDTLLDLYNLDNTPFLNQLSNLGFYVATCSQSNYAQTQLSLPSSLNFEYLADISDQYTAGHTTRNGLVDLLQHNAVRQILEGMGYKTVAFETGFRWTEWDDADLYLSPQKGWLEEAQFWAGMNGFEELLLRTTAGLAIIDGAILPLKGFKLDLSNPLLIHRDRILYVLDQLGRLPSIPGPKFVFVHLVIPHPPYVFGPNGEFEDYDKEDYPGYREQVTYINQRILPLVTKMITDSKTPPIIILQGDHGPIHAPPNKRMNILNAYHFPGGSQMLYKNISPVNSFRVLFNTYFGGSYNLAEDVSYFSNYQAPFKYTVIPNTRPGCEGKP